MENLEELTLLAQKVDKILKEELDKEKINHDFAEVRIYNVRSVGVQGDERTYSFPVEICLYRNKKFVWDTEFLSRLSSRITNEVKPINRVVYVTAIKNNDKTY